MNANDLYLKWYGIAENAWKDGYNRDATLVEQFIADILRLDPFLPPYTSALPTIPGRYWHRSPNGAVEIIRVITGREELLSVYGGEWSGPIPEPGKINGDDCEKWVS
jgi:hypothetical protein